MKTPVKLKTRPFLLSFTCNGKLIVQKTEWITLLINSSRSSAVLFMSPVRVVFISLASSLTVSCKNLAYCSLVFDLLWCASCSLILSWKVEGSMFGKTFKNTGSRSSINGTTIKMANGTRRNISAVVLVSCCLSLRVRLFPLANLSSNLEETLTSVQRSLVPTQ